MRLPVESPWARAVRFRDATNEETFFAPRPPVRIVPARDDTFHEWGAGDRLGLLAFRAWGSASLWWVLCDLNDVLDPSSIAVGTRLRLPSRARVELALLG